MCLFTVVVFLFVYSLIQCIYRSSSVCVRDFKNRKMVLLIKFAFFVLSSTNPEFLEHPPARKRSKSTRAPHGGGVKCARSNCSWCTGAELWHPQTLLKWLLDNRSRQSEDISKRDTTLALNVTKHVFPDSRHQIMHHTLLCFMLQNYAMRETTSQNCATLLRISTWKPNPLSDVKNKMLTRRDKGLWVSH